MFFYTIRKPTSGLIKQRKMETVHSFKTMYSFKIFRMIKYFPLNIFHYSIWLKGQNSSVIEISGFLSRERNTGHCVKTLIWWKREQNWRKTIQLKIKCICFNQVSINRILKILSCQKNMLERQFRLR